MSHAEREQREAEVMADLLSVERDESALVWSAMEKNLPCEHRSDINPVALLGLAIVTAARATNGHASSPEHVLDIVRR